MLVTKVKSSCWFDSALRHTEKGIVSYEPAMQQKWLRYCSLCQEKTLTLFPSFTSTGIAPFFVGCMLQVSLVVPTEPVRYLLPVDHTIDLLLQNNKFSHAGLESATFRFGVCRTVSLRRTERDIQCSRRKQDTEPQAVRYVQIGNLTCYLCASPKAKVGNRVSNAGLEPATYRLEVCRAAFAPVRRRAGFVPRWDYFLAMKNQTKVVKNSTTIVTTDEKKRFYD